MKEMGAKEKCKAHLNVAATAVDVLLVLHGELDYDRLILVLERLIELARDGVKASILRSTEACKPVSACSREDELEC